MKNENCLLKKILKICLSPPRKKKNEVKKKKFKENEIYIIIIKLLNKNVGREGVSIILFYFLCLLLRGLLLFRGGAGKCLPWERRRRKSRKFDMWDGREKNSSKLEDLIL